MTKKTGLGLFLRLPIGFWFLVILFNHWYHVSHGFGIVRIISFTSRYTLVEDVRPRKL